MKVFFINWKDIGDFMMKCNNKFNLALLIPLLVFTLPGRYFIPESHGQVVPATGVIHSVPVPAAPLPDSSDDSQNPGILNPKGPTPVDENTDTLTFKDFGFDELTLRGPFASGSYYFDMPPTWSIKDGAELRLVFDTFFTSTTSNPQALVNTHYGGTLLVQYNYVNIATIDLTQEGRQQIAIPIPLDILNSLGKSQSQAIQLILDSGVNCDVDFRTTVIVRTNSQLYLPHDLVDPSVDLRFLPSPLYLNSINERPTILIVPDNPTAGEMQAALSVAAGFGRMTFNRLAISLLPTSQVSSDQLANANVIFVGKASGLPLLQQVFLPAPLSDGKFTVEQSEPTDGIVQMAVSPWNKNNVVLVVGGNEDGAVINAAQALSTGTLQVGKNPSLSVISSIQAVSFQYDATVVDQTFDDLGYGNVVVNQVGLNTVTYKFNVPQGYTLGPDAYLNLIFSHTAILEYDRSNIVVKLNEEPVGSIRLSDQTASQGSAKILLPASTVRPGSNRLSFEIYMESRNECVNPLFSGLWMRIDPSSSLHLPFIPNPANSSILMDLSRYPSPFAFDPVMNDLAIVLAPNDPTGWNIAAKLAFSLGNSSAIQIAGLETYYADAVPDEALQQRNILVVGRPSSLKIISDLNDKLPAPFEPGTDLAIEKNLQVSYRLAPGVDVGYLELISSPWNPIRNILFVGGSSDLGLQWAGDTLLFGRLQSQLSGNLAFINGEQIVSADTRILQGAQGVLSTAVPVNLTPSAVQTQPPVVEHPVWILPTILTVLGGILIVLIILGVQSLVRRRSGK
jgi:hypothetical protein